MAMCLDRCVSAEAVIVLAATVSTFCVRNSVLGRDAVLEMSPFESKFSFSIRPYIRSSTTLCYILIFLQPPHEIYALEFWDFGR